VLAAMRDAAMLKTVYAFGLRRREACGLDVTDLRRNPRAPAYGEFGALTHLVEFDYPERFVQDQVGHAYASTTAIYTGVSDEYRNRLLERSLKNRYGELWEEQP
jgi:site-specific recombinase XerD